MRKKLLLIGILLILALLGGGYWYLDYYNTNTSLATGQKVRFTVTHGMTTGDIATLLYNKKLIQTPGFLPDGRPSQGTGKPSPGRHL